MMASQNLMRLAAALADHFTVYLPDRRGRGLSGPFGEHFGISKAVDDLQALIAHSGSERIFGLSVGAIVALFTALVTPAVRKVAAFEPPIALTSVPRSSPTSWLPRYDREIAQGKLAEALVTVAKGIADAPIFSALPRFIAVPLMKAALPIEARETSVGDVALMDLIPTMHYDARIVLDTADQLDKLRAIPAHVLLLQGGRSPAYFKRILDAVHAMLPSSPRVELPGLGHTSADNGGKPLRIAQELQRFLAE
jgi:pimeloyl-ACP methyl ester carboxylesterase